MKLIILLASLLLSFAIHAEEQGGLAIVTTPVDAEIYIDGVLKANSSPAYILLSEGKHQLEVRKTGKKTEVAEIVIGKDTVVKKELVLSDAQAEPAVTVETKIVNLLNPIRDSFETHEEFQQRRENLLKQFNEAVQRHEIAFQAGIATLDKNAYDITSNLFPMKIEWSDWAKNYRLPEMSYLVVIRDDAKKMWAEGEKKPVFLYMQKANIGSKPDKQCILALNREWITAKYAQFSLDLLSEVRSLSFSGNSSLLAATNSSNSVLVWKLDSQRLAETDLARLSPSSRVYFHPTKSSLATIFIGALRFENLVTERTDKSFSTDFSYIFGAAFSPDGNSIAVANATKITIWDTNTDETKHTLNQFDKQIIRIAYAVDGKTLAVINNEGQMEVVNLESKKTVQSFEISKLTPEQLLGFSINYKPALWDNFVANQRHIAKIAADKKSVLLTDNISHETSRLVGQESEIVVLALSPNGLWLAAGHKNGQIDLWRLM